MKHIIVGISGKQGSGKTTLAKGLLSLVPAGHHVKFADPLYAMHEAIRGVLNQYGQYMPAKDGKLLQLLGTEWGRATMGENIWVDLAHTRLKQIQAGAEKSFTVVDDARFPNELALFASLNAPDTKVLTVRLECDEYARRARAEGWRNATNHPSEVALDGRDDFDLVLDTEKLAAIEVLTAVVERLGGLAGFRKPYIPGGEA